MPFFKKKDKKDGINESSYLKPPRENGPNGDQTQRPGPEQTPSQPNSNSDLDRSSNLSSADTRVNHGGRTVVTTTTTTTTTTTSSDGRQQEQESNGRPMSELPADTPRPPSRGDQNSQMPLTSATLSSPPNIPNRDARRGSHPDSITSTQQQPPIPNRQYDYQSPDSYSQPSTSPSNPNFSRPGGRRENIKTAAVGIHGAGETLRGAFNAKAGKIMHENPDMLAKHEEVMNQGLREVRSSEIFKRIPVAQSLDGRKLHRRSGGLDSVDERSRNF